MALTDAATPPQLLVLRALGLGDLLTGVPALRGLMRAFPDHHRVLALPAPLAPLALWAGVADEVVSMVGLEPTASLPHRPEVAVNLHGCGPISHGVLLNLEPGRLLAFARAEIAGCESGPEWRDGEYEPRRWVRMVQAFGVAADETELDVDAPATSPRPAAIGATVIHPGAASGARRWPVDRWVRVARHEVAAGRSVVVTGGPDERRLAETVCRGAGLPVERHCLAGSTDVMGLAGVVAGAARVVCGDTGVAHLATAMGTPSVVLFGPTSPEAWGPPPGRPIHRALWTGTTGDPHAHEPDAGLLGIAVHDVIAALDDLDGLDQPDEPDHGGADVDAAVGTA